MTPRVRYSVGTAANSVGVRNLRGHAGAAGSLATWREIVSNFMNCRLRLSMSVIQLLSAGKIFSSQERKLIRCQKEIFLA